MRITKKLLCPVCTIKFESKQKRDKTFHLTCNNRKCNRIYIRCVKKFLDRRSK